MILAADLLAALLALAFSRFRSQSRLGRRRFRPARSVWLRMVRQYCACLPACSASNSRVFSMAMTAWSATGATRLSVDLGPKRLQLAHDILPAAISMAMLVNPAKPAIAERERTAVAKKTRTRASTYYTLVLLTSDTMCR